MPIGKNSIFLIIWVISLPGLSYESLPSEHEYIGSQRGLSCGDLVDLSESEIAALTHPDNRLDFDNFCMPEDIYSCSDYNGLLYQFGTLEPNSQYQCRFIPL